jgi:phenylacetate-CoA oxygenase PaaJ subunit
VPDPEIPVISIVDLGIVRDVELDELGVCIVTLTPTYSGCPATEVIAEDVRQALSDIGCTSIVIKTQLAPAWTTDWMNDETKAKLREYGIAPPHVTSNSEQRIGTTACGWGDFSIFASHWFVSHWRPSKKQNCLPTLRLAIDRNPESVWLYAVQGAIPLP